MHQFIVGKMSLLLKKLYVLRRLEEKLLKHVVNSPTLYADCIHLRYTVCGCVISMKNTPNMSLALVLGSVRAVILVPGRLMQRHRHRILCCIGPVAHTRRGGFTHRFAHCVCDNKPPHSPSNPLHPSWSCWAAEKSRASCWRMEREDPAVGR